MNIEISEHIRVVLALVTLLSLCVTLLYGLFGDPNNLRQYTIFMSVTIIVAFTLCFSLNRNSRFT